LLQAGAYDHVAKNKSLFRNLPVVVRRAIERAQALDPGRWGDLHFETAEESGARERVERQPHQTFASDEEHQNAEQRHASEMAAAAARVSEPRTKYDASLATAMAARDAVVQTLAGTQAALDRAERGRASDLAAAADRLAQCQAEEGIDGPYRTSGNLILGTDNSPYLFHGIARDNLEYFCKSDGHYTQQDLAYLGLGDTSARATYWGANTVRLPLSENFWLYGSPSQNCSPDEYQALFKQVVDILTGLNLNVMINLQWTNAGGQSTGAGDAWAMPGWGF
jgi:hypothetical protein